MQLMDLKIGAELKLNGERPMTVVENASKAFHDLLALAAIGATGKHRQIKVDDWSTVIALSQEQVVLSLVGIPLLENFGIECPEDLRNQVIEVTRLHSSTNLIKKQRILNLLQELEAMGVCVQLIKGYPIAECYAYPETRESNDTDILILPDQEKVVCDYLRDRGFRVDKRGKTSHHAVGQHPKLGMVEVHVQLYAELMQDVWFQHCKQDIQIQEDFISVKDSIRYTTLGHTDHLLFLTLHTIKHFIISGMGIRMMLDVALYFSKHKDEIDLERYWRVLSELQYAGFVNAVLWSLIDTGCFDSSEFPGIGEKCPHKIQMLLCDLEKGGHMGVKDYVPEGSYEYSRQVMMRSQNQWRYWFNMLRMKIRDASQYMFPNKEGLIRIYPILKEHRWMWPFLRIYQVFAYPLQKICSGDLNKHLRSNSTEMTEEAERRFKLFKMLGMI